MSGNRAVTHDAMLGETLMRTKRVLLSVLAAGAIGLAAPHRAQATTITATLCDINVGAGACPVVDTLDFGVRFNFVPLLGINRWAWLPFSFSDATATATGNVFVVDIAGTWIYLYGQGVVSGNGAAIPVFLNLAITQDYLTFPQPGTFSGIDAGFCNAAAGLAGSGQTGFAFVNGAPLASAGGTACNAFLQTFGPLGAAMGGVTNLTAVADFNMGVGGGQLITLPWGDDFPDVFAPTLNSLFGLGLTSPPAPGSDPSTDTIITTLNGLGLTQQVPEPSTLSVLGIGLIALCLRRRKD